MVRFSKSDNRAIGIKSEMANDKSNKTIRTLQAALFADIVCHNQSTSNDDHTNPIDVSKYFALFKDHCDRFDGEIEQSDHNGVFALFSSAVNAIECAVETQQAVLDHNDKAETPMTFRVGINLGEVLRNNDGVFGDSLNIAERLEGLAEPGCVCISGAVYEQVRNKLAYGYEYLGSQLLKNVTNPIEAYQVRRDINGVTMAASPRFPTREIQSSLPNKPSVVVLPFVDQGSDETESWFADGITEDITSNLSKFQNLFVISRNSAFLYRNRKIPPQQVSKELGVRYVAQGTIRKAGNRARISVELVDAESGQMIWGERYNRNIDDIFEVQDEIANTVVVATAAQIETSETDRARVKPPSDMAAYDFVLQGQQYAYRYRRSDNSMARQLFQAAQEVDARYARASAAISRTLNIDWRYSWSDNQDVALDKALEYARKAVEFDAGDARGFGELGFAHLYRKEHDAALDAYERALRLNPNDADLMSDMADALCHCGRNEEGILLLEKAMLLNPFYPDQYLWHLGGALYNMNQYEEAIIELQKMHNQTEGRRLLAASCGQLGRIDEAKMHAAKVLEAHPDFSLEAWAAVQPDKSQAEVDHFVEGLKKAGLR